MFFRFMSKFFDYSLKTIFFLFELGLKGIAGLLFLLFIAGYIFIELWSYILMYAVIGAIAFFVIRYLYRTYQKGKGNYVEEQAEKVFEKVFSKYESRFEAAMDTEEILEQELYREAVVEKLPNEKQASFYAQQMRVLDSIDVSKLKLDMWNMDDLGRYYRQKIYRELNKKGIPTPLIGNYNRYISYFIPYYREVRDTQLANSNIIRAGQDGENRMEQELMSFKDIEGFRYLSNVQLQFGDKSFETDFLVISKHGIFSLEVKNIGSKGNVTIRITPDGQWLKVLGNGQAVSMKDISSQVNYHISMTEGMLRQYKKETGNTVTEVRPIIILANNSVMLDNQANLPIYRVSKFIQEMKAYPSVMSKKDIDDLYEWLQQYQVATKKYEVYDYTKNMKQAYDLMLQTRQYIDIMEECLKELRQETDHYLLQEISMLKYKKNEKEVQ